MTNLETLAWCIAIIGLTIVGTAIFSFFLNVWVHGWDEVMSWKDEN